MVETYVQHSIWCTAMEEGDVGVGPIQPHLMDAVKESVRKLKTDSCVIPGGLMSALQPFGCLFEQTI